MGTSVRLRDFSVLAMILGLIGAAQLANAEDAFVLNRPLPKLESLLPRTARQVAPTFAAPPRHVIAPAQTVTAADPICDIFANGYDVTGAAPCATCFDGVKNWDETDTDCGGAWCTACADGKHCLANSDCISTVCNTSTTVCAPATCADGILDGSETDVDCGGGVCPTCGNGKNCIANSDCNSNLCTSGICTAPAPCAATTENGDCDVSATSSGGTSGTCAAGYTGNCSFSCSNGTWTQVTDTCAAQCAATSQNNCVLTTTNSGNTDTGTCAFGYTGSCTFACSNGIWTQVTDSCAAQCPAETLNNCVLMVTNSGLTDPGTCAVGYTGSCSFSCSNGTWIQVTDTCAAQCPAATENGNCDVSLTNSGGTSGTCAAGFTTGSCSFSCTNGSWTQISDTCAP